MQVFTDIPMPPRAERSDESYQRIYPFADLQVGQMFFAPGKHRKTMQPYTSYMARRLQVKFSTRTLHMAPTDDGGWKPVSADTPDAVAGVGVWRVK